MATTPVCYLPSPLGSVQQYQTPPGKVDIPFCYMFDCAAAGLVNGQNYTGLSVTLHQDSDFILRHIAGVPLCVAAAPNGRFNHYNPDGSYANSNSVRGILVPNNWPVIPEKLYRDHIFFDLFSFLGTFVNQGQFSSSYIGFFGVKRFADTRTNVRQTPYKYVLTPYTYIYNLAITPRTTPPIPLFQPLDQWDFELYRITVGAGPTPRPAGTGGLLTQDFSLTLYDATLDKQFSTLPIPQGFINSARQTAILAPPYQACFPVPAVIYTGNGVIRFDIQSNMSPGAPNLWNYFLQFEGAKRIPA